MNRTGAVIEMWPKQDRSDVVVEIDSDHKPRVEPTLREIIGDSQSEPAPAGGPAAVDGQPDWLAAIDLVRSAATKTRMYEQAFRSISDATKRLISKTHIERLALEERVSELESKVAELEANNRLTLGMLDDSLIYGSALKARMRDLEEDVLLAEQDVQETTGYLIRIVQILKASL